MTLDLEQYLHESMDSVVDADKLYKLIVNNNLEAPVLQLFTNLYSGIDKVKNTMDALLEELSDE